jgi:hypothetical protein
MAQYTVRIDYPTDSGGEVFLANRGGEVFVLDAPSPEQAVIASLQFLLEKQARSSLRPPRRSVPMRVGQQVRLAVERIPDNIRRGASLGVARGPERGDVEQSHYGLAGLTVSQRAPE